MLTTGELYREAGGDYYSRRNPNVRPNASSPSSNASGTSSPCRRQLRRAQACFPLAHAPVRLPTLIAVTVTSVAVTVLPFE